MNFLKNIEIKSHDVFVFIICLLIFVVGYHGARFYDNSKNERRAEFSRMIAYGIGLAPFVVFVGSLMFSNVEEKLKPRGVYALFALFMVLSIAYCSMLINDINSSKDIEHSKTAKTIAGIVLASLLVLFILNLVYIYNPVVENKEYYNIAHFKKTTSDALSNLKNPFETPKPNAFGNMEHPALFGFGR
jgi:hypothetical protein